MACSLPGCASKSPARQREAVALSRDYVAEVIRYLYRWHADETLLASPILVHVFNMNTK
jgi:hypothetical protein